MGLEPGSVRARLDEAAHRAWRLYCALEMEIPHKATVVDEIKVQRQKLVASTIPWNASAATLTLELHSEVRRLEVHLTEQVSGGYRARRGGSRDNTLYALRAIPKLAHGVDDQSALSAFLILDRWGNKADAALNPEKGLHRVPREPGAKEMRCPYCGYQTMRWNPTNAVIVCINPECTTGDGERPRWIAEFTVQGNALAFSWQPFEAAA